MVSMATSILLMLFVQGAIGLTKTTTTQGTTTPQTFTTMAQETTTTPNTTTSQDNTTQPIATTSQVNTTPLTTTSAQNTTTSQTSTTSQGTTTPPTTTTSQGTTTLPIATTSQETITPPITTTSQWTTTSPIATTSQGTTTPQATPTTQITTTSQTTTTSQGTTTPQTTTTSQGTTTLPIATTSQVTTTPIVSTSQWTTTSPIAATSQGTTNPQTIPTTQTATTSQNSTTSQGTTTPPTTTTSQGTTTPQTTTTSQGTTTLPIATTSQVTTTPIASTSQWTTTSPIATTSQGTTTPLTTTTTQTATTSQTSTTSEGTTTSPTTITSHGITTPTTTATSQYTTISQITITSQGTTSARSPVFTPSKELAAYEPDPGYYDLRLQFDLKLYLDFKDAYGDRTTTEFQSMATNISVSLTEHFRYIKGFKSIEILRFRLGSVFVDYTVNVYGTVDILAVTSQIEKEAVDTLKDVAGVPVDVDYTRTSMKSRLGSLRARDRCSLVSANLCPFGYYCKQGDTTTLLCIDRCNVSVCENNGLCYIGHLSQDVQCKCPISDGAVFTGDRCQTKQVVMTIQERNLYLIIAGSIFGAFIVSFVLTVCIINRKRKILKKKLSINLRMNQGQVHKAGVKYIRDDHKRYADSNETSLNRRQNIFDTADNPYQERKAQAVDDGYIHSVQDVREDDGYLRPPESIRRKDDSEYDYIK